MTERLVTLLDGRQVSSYSPEWRHECEARTIANFPTKEARHKQIALVRAFRGAEVARELEALAREIFDAEVAPKLRGQAAQGSDDGCNEPTIGRQD